MPFITQGKANIRYLLIVFLVAVVAGGIIFYTWNCYQKETSNIEQTLQIKQADKLKISADVVWSRVLDSDILSALHQCDYSSSGCVTGVMSNSGASPEAINFYKEEKWFVTKLTNYGKVSLLEVVDPWRANSNEDYVLVNGKQHPITIEGAVGSVEGEVFKTFPKYTLWSTDNYFSGKDGNSFIFNVELKNGCHTCSTGYDAIISFDFDQDGNYLGEHLVGFCTEEGTIDIKYSGCITLDDTANWKTYRNEEYSFEIKYPPSIEKNQIRVINSENFISEYKYSHPNLFSIEFSFLPKILFTIEAFDNIQPELSPIEWVKKYGISCGNLGYYDEFVKDNAKGINAKVSDNCPPHYSHRIYESYLFKGQKVYSLKTNQYYLNEGIVSNEEKEIKQTFNLMLSTFKFIGTSTEIVCTEDRKACSDGFGGFFEINRAGPNCEFGQCPELKGEDTTSWKLYKNSNLGIEFKIAPLFEEAGYEIKESQYQNPYFGKQICNVISFNTKPIGPYIYGGSEKDRTGALFTLFVCPIKDCDDEICQGIRENKIEIPDKNVTLFTKYITENENYLVFDQGGPGSGDFADSMGWLQEMVVSAKVSMFSTFKFLNQTGSNIVP